MKLIHQIRRALRDSRGFTLVELITGMAVSSILLLGVVMSMPTIEQNYMHSIERSYAKIMANTIAGNLRDQLTFATEAELSGEITASDGGVAYHTISYSRNGTKPTTIEPDASAGSGDYYNRIEGLSYDPSGTYFMGKKARLSFRALSSHLCEVEIQIFYRGNPLYSMTYDISTLNCDITIA